MIRVKTKGNRRAGTNKPRTVPIHKQSPVHAHTEGRVKYVILGQNNVMVFSGTVSHYDASLSASEHYGGATRAGFVDFTPEGPQAFGRSDSLRRESHPIDSEVISQAFRDGAKYLTVGSNKVVLLSPDMDPDLVTESVRLYGPVHSTGFVKFAPDGPEVSGDQSGLGDTQRIADLVGHTGSTEDGDVQLRQ